MITPEKEHLLVKYFSNEATAIELDELENWIGNPENEIILKDFTKVHYAITIAMKDSNSNKTKERLFNEMNRDKNIFRNGKIQSLLKYAALAIVFIGLGYFFRQHPFEPENKKSVIPAEEAITLETDHGEIQKLSNTGFNQIKDHTGNILGEQKGNKLVYNKKSTIKKLTYNTLKVPYGKKFDVLLSDGTRVFLNAGSSLKYPVRFLEGKQRQVFLEGEAYFDVVHDSKTSFMVGTQELDVEVYGTRFNVSNYASDAAINVVLIEGAVGLNTKTNESENTVRLEPGFKGTFDKTGKTLATGKVDTTLYTAWMNNNLVFRNTPFKTIIKQLERQYNIVIINNNKQLGEEAFNATFETKKETIEQVFEYFSKIHDVDYQIFNNKIIIN
ncbi:DUF4974 domain-containing protein [Sinomicrobium kalidii]|uniref:FecR family protein n=1 Tax=Sinomicrobium kalidii TaxID=2900738 RepID=UPI001E4063EA|nr:FecR domain-containing protein [Sinomicrobium kalidii]UGU17432.1 DUF4974 domain-containing protein [Sinomicrobium kalidii]